MLGIIKRNKRLLTQWGGIGVDRRKGSGWQVVALLLAVHAYSSVSVPIVAKPSLRAAVPRLPYFFAHIIVYFPSFLCQGSPFSCIFSTALEKSKPSLATLGALRSCFFCVLCFSKNARVNLDKFIGRRGFCAFCGQKNKRVS